MEEKNIITKYRWVICSLLFFATTINYIDRSVMGILKATLQREIGWNEAEYGIITAAFTAAYTFGAMFFGKIIDKYGTKIGYHISVFIWSIAAMSHALTKTPFGFGTARASLGLGESGNFPAANKTIAEWFPKKERALAFGIFNSGANVGAVVVPIIVPWLTLSFGWQSAFIATGSIGFVWMLVWQIYYNKPEVHKKVSKLELDYILSDKEEEVTEKLTISSILKHKQIWAFLIAKFTTDPVWWFYLFWLPGFLGVKYGLDLTHLGWPLIIIYTMTSIGSIGGGRLSGKFIDMGWTISKSRKAVMMICAILIVPVIFILDSSLWSCVLLLGLATAAHQGWSANLFSTASDMFPKKAMGTVTSLGVVAGGIGGVLFQILTGFILQYTGSYFLLFAFAGSIYLITLFIFNLIVPNIKTVVLS
jgi:MFS transporter, ACS family, hexuronate transporter